MGNKVRKVKKVLNLDYNLTQRKNLAKFLYDVAKLGLGGVVLTGFMKETLVWWKLGAGLILTVIPVFMALYFETEEKEDNDG